MIPFLQELNKEFKKVCPESYLEYNTSQNVVYPYLTYTFNSEDLEVQEGFYIDVEVFDNCGTNTINLEVLTHNLKKYFKDNVILNDDVLLQFEYMTSKTIPTTSNEIRRRWIQLYCKVDWRR